MKYLNDPHDGCIGPQITMYLFQKMRLTHF